MSPCLALARISPPEVQIPLRLCTGPEAVATKIAIRLWTLRGQWPDDVLLGLPLLDWALPTYPDAVVEAAVRRQVAAVPGVVEIIEVTASYSGTTRTIVVRVRLDSDEEIVVGDLPISAGYIPGVWWVLARPGYRPIYPGGY